MQTTSGCDVGEPLLDPLLAHVQRVDVPRGEPHQADTPRPMLARRLGGAPAPSWPPSSPSARPTTSWRRRRPSWRRAPSSAGGVATSPAPSSAARLLRRRLLGRRLLGRRLLRRRLLRRCLPASAAADASVSSSAARGATRPPSWPVAATAAASPPRRRRGGPGARSRRGRLRRRCGDRFGSHGLRRSLRSPGRLGGVARRTCVGGHGGVSRRGLRRRRGRRAAAARRFAAAGRRLRIGRRLGDDRAGRRSMLQRAGAKLTTSRRHGVAELEHLAGAPRRRVGEQAERHVAAHVADRDVGAVRRVRVDHAVDGAYRPGGCCTNSRNGISSLTFCVEASAPCGRGAAAGAGGAAADERFRPRDDLGATSAGAGASFSTIAARRAPPAPRRPAATAPAAAPSAPASAGWPACSPCGGSTDAPPPPPLRAGPAADRPLDRQPIDEHPADERHRLATDQAALVEQPRVLAVELLERVVAQDPRADLVGDAQHEGVAAADGAGRRRHQLVVGDRLVERG